MMGGIILLILQTLFWAYVWFEVGRYVGRKERNQDPSLTRWSGKTLALTLNMADMAIYYYDLYMEYFRRRGFTPVPEWQRKADRLRDAATEFRKFTAHFFKGANIDAYFGQMGELLDGVARRCYTDRERKYLEEYEQH